MSEPDGSSLRFSKRGEWPAKWIYAAGARGRTPVVFAYRRRFTMERAARVRLHVSADERYDLFLDGVRIGRGPERGDPRRWYYDTYDVDLVPGEHVLVARVWSLGIGPAPWSQTSAAHGFLLCPQEAEFMERLATGVAPWDAKELDGYRFVTAAHTAWASTEVVDGSRYAWGFETGAGAGWAAATAGAPARSGSVASFVHTYEPTLYPPRLPALLAEVRHAGQVRQVDDPGTLECVERPIDPAGALAEDAPRWQALISAGAPLTIPPHTRRRVIIDLQNYYNAYPQVLVRGGRGSEIRQAWDEALRLTPELGGKKGNRNDVAGKFFAAQADVFLPAGGDKYHFAPLWWRCGRYVQLLVQTGAEPLIIEDLCFEETRYPYEDQGSFQSDDARFDRLLPICVRGVQSCAHESYMDCPYYEQQMWVGDMRVQMLISHVLNRDPRLIQRCIEYIGLTRDGERMVLGRYPAPQRLWIPSFAMWWIAMLHDFARYRGAREFIRTMMPAARGTIDSLLEQMDATGLARTAWGWNFTDWSRHPAWQMGEPPRSLQAPSAIYNWQLVLTLDQMTQLERWLDEPELAARHARRADGLTQAALATLWRQDVGLFADDPAGKTYSEHAQALAVLTGRLSAGMQARIRQVWDGTPDLARTSLYFDFYTLAALARLQRMDLFFARLEPYFAFAGAGLVTTPETAGETRSDCHAWAAHPRFHVVSTLLGIEPAEFGFERVRIAPKPGSLRQLAGSMPHPRGEIAVSLTRAGGKMRAEIKLPEGVSGEFVYGEVARPLGAGTQVVE